MENRHQTITTAQMLEKLELCTAAGGAFHLRVTGTSMAPFLKPGRDSVALGKVSSPLKKGDVAMFLRPGGEPILHRVCEVRDDGYMFLGDNQWEPEGPVPHARVVALMVGATIDGKAVKPGSLRWEFFRRLWSVRPLRKLAWRLLG